jgi:hypothetical protein
MGGEQAAKTMSEVFRAGAARKGREVDEAMLAEQEARVIAHYDRQAVPSTPPGACSTMASSIRATVAGCWP